MKLVIFEDDQFDRFCPLAWVRGVFELRTGATALADKIERAVRVSPSALLVRDYLCPTVKRRHPDTSINDLSSLTRDEVLFVNARVRASQWKPPSESAALWKDGQLAAWRTSDNVSSVRTYADLAAMAQKAPRSDFTGGWYGYIWDLMLANPEEITFDFDASGRSGIQGDIHDSAVVFGPKERLFIGPGAEIHPFVCIDTRSGPVTLEAGCEVHPFTRIEGPCYVGEKCTLLGAKVREGCSFGPVCRVGGEVEESIIHGHSNKYHDGFLGHAYVGEWVNLGALTTNSDLKNDYSSVSVIMNGETLETGSPKVGSFIGDHVKTSIGTLLNTGSIAGTMAILVSNGSPLPKYIPPYAWFLNGKIGKGFGLNPLIDTARMAMSRRKVEMTADDEKLLRHVFELTQEDRDTHVRRARKAMKIR